MLTAAMVMGMSVPAWAGVADDPSVTLVYSIVNSENATDGKTALYFKQQVEALSGGSITIDLEMCGVLGLDTKIPSDMTSGVKGVDMACVNVGGLADLGLNKTRLLKIPYTWTSHDHYWNFVMSSLADEFLNEPHEYGLPIQGLSFVEVGFRHFAAVNPLNSINDFQGQKIRGSGNEGILNDLIEALGAEPVVSSYIGLYTALQTGEVSGFEQPLVNIVSEAFYEVAPNIILDGHNIDCREVIITDSAWNKLTGAQQDVIRQASRLAQEYNKTFIANQDNEELATLRAVGCNIVDVTDITPWRNASAAVTSKYSAGYEALYQQLLNCAY